MSPASLMKHHVTEHILANQANLMDGIAQEVSIIETNSLGSERKARLVCIDKAIFEIECRSQNR